MTTARKFGLDFVGDIPWGTHLCQFYESKHDLTEILVPYFAEGLRSNEACVWVTSEPLKEREAAAALEKVVPDIAQYIEKGQLFILPYTEVHMKGGTFDADRVIQWWLEKEQEALNRGFEGMRLAGNTFWIEQDLWDAFTDYEETVNDALEGHRIIAVCPYSLEKCSGSDVTDVIRNHGGTIIKKGETWSVVEDVVHRKEAEVALQRAHHELEQKVEERTNELQKETEERKRAEKHAERLAKFPKESPNPVMRLNAEGEILYANKPAKRLLEDWDGTKSGVAPQPLRDAAIEALSNQANKTIEVEERSRIYDFFVAPIVDAGCANFYGRDITERKKAEESLKRIEWLLTRETVPSDRRHERQIQPYGDVTALNTSRVIADSVGEDMLADIVDDYHELLDTSAAVYERDGSYALGLFTSGWCRLLDLASRERCGTEDNAEALRSGKWLCHESCWTDASKTSIETGRPVDIKCNGGIHIYAVPIYADKRIVGSMNFGYGDPPTDPVTLQAVADLYGINNIGNLREEAEAYQSRPPYIIELAKDRLKTSARLVGEMMYRRQKDLELQKAHEEMQSLNQELRFVNEFLEERVEERTIELQNEIGERTVVEEELRKASEEVRAASLYSRSLIEASLDPLVTISVEGKITDVNKATEEVTGAPREQLIGSDFSSYFTKPEKARKGYEQVFKNGYVWDYPLAIRHTSGKITDVLYNAAVYGNEAGEIQGVFAAARDVTERKKAEEALQKAHEEVQALNEELQSTNEELRFANETLEERVKERTFDLQEEIEERKVTEEELRVTTEEFQRSNKELEQFAYIASHDLQEPLRTVSSAIGLLERGYKDELGEEAETFINYAIGGAKHMQQLIRALLDYSRVTTRGEVFTAVHCDNVAQNAIDNLEASVEESEVKITLPDKPLPTVMGDQTQLIQLFQNLIGNAIKFRSERPPEVQIDAMLDGGRNTWRFSIKDNGIGMDMQYADKIFTIFERLHTTE